MNEWLISHTRDRLAANQRRLETSEKLLRQSAKLLPVVPPVRTSRPHWWNARAVENERWLRELGETNSSLCSEATEMCVTVPKTRTNARRACAFAQQLQARASTLKEELARSRDRCAVTKDG